MLEVILTSAMAFIAVSTDELFAVILFFSAAIANEDGEGGICCSDVIIGQYLAFTFIVALSVLSFLLQTAIPINYISLLGFIPLVIGIQQLISVYKFWCKSFQKKEGNEEEKEKTFQPVFKVELLAPENRAITLDASHYYTIENELRSPSAHSSRDGSHDDDDDEKSCLAAFVKYFDSKSICFCRAAMFKVFVTLLADGTEEVGVFVPLFATTTSISNFIARLVTFYFLLTVYIVLAYVLVSSLSVGSIISRYSKNVIPLILICLGIYVLSNSIVVEFIW